MKSNKCKVILNIEFINVPFNNSAGAYGPEKSQKVAEVKPEPQKIKEGIEKISLWKKGEHGRNKKAKYIYKSIEDVLDQSWQPQRKREFK